MMYKVKLILYTANNEVLPNQFMKVVSTSMPPNSVVYLVSNQTEFREEEIRSKLPKEGTVRFKEGILIFVIPNNQHESFKKFFRDEFGIKFTERDEEISDELSEALKGAINSEINSEITINPEITIIEEEKSLVQNVIIPRMEKLEHIILNENLPFTKTDEIIPNIDNRIEQVEKQNRNILITVVVIGLVIPVLLTVLFCKYSSSTKSCSEVSYESQFNEIISQLDRNTNKLNEIQNLLKLPPPPSEEPINNGMDSDDTSESGNYWDWYDCGAKRGNLGRYKEAIECYDKALEVKPNHFWSWYNRSYSLVKLERYEEAINSYKKALKIDTDDKAINEHKFWCWYELGSTLFHLGCYQKAIESYRNALIMNPRHEGVQKDQELAQIKLKKQETVPSICSID